MLTTTAIAALLAGCASMLSDTPQPANWTKDEVADSYVFGYPLVLMSIARDAAVGSDPGQAPINTLRDALALPPVGASSPPTPSVDTLDSSGWLDVSSEPVIVTLPEVRGRYIDGRALDMWTNVIWSTGTQAGASPAGPRSQSIAFVAPGWQGTLPPNVKRVDTPTKTIWFAARIQTNGTDLTAVRKLQRSIRVVPLSVYNGDAPAAFVIARSSGSDPAATGTPAAQVAALDADGFFNRLALALPDSPPSPADPHALATLADIGVTPDAPAVLPRASDAVAAGVAAARARIATPPPNLLMANGWSWLGDGAGNYGPDYALRAYAAYTQPGVGTKDDEVRATTRVDSDGRPLSGPNRYVIHFAPKQLPPVRGFWSITAYTADGALGDTPQARVSCGEHRGGRRTRDGSLDVTVSATKPKGGNWLPVPRADFQLVMRLYAPKAEATNGLWQPPTVMRQ
jgi:hypothetical protein